MATYRSRVRGLAAVLDDFAATVDLTNASICAAGIATSTRRLGLQRVVLASVHEGLVTPACRRARLKLFSAAKLKEMSEYVERHTLGQPGDDEVFAFASLVGIGVVQTIAAGPRTSEPPRQQIGICWPTD